jgi:hypothetical protein
MDGVSTTHQFTDQVTNLLTGQVTPQTHTIISVATGLNYQDSSGNWLASQDIVELNSDGSAAAVQGPIKAYFVAAGLNDDAALTIAAPGLPVLTVRVQGVYLFDTQSGQSELLAAPSDSAVLELLPPNQVIYRSAFNSDVFRADLRYTWTKAGLECDVIITSQPKASPAELGLNPATTLLQVRHQWQNAPAPVSIRQIAVGGATGTEMPDQFIDLGGLFFPPGAAFLTDGASSTDTNAPAQLSAANPQSVRTGVPVGKEWQTGVGPGGSSLLIESVNWSSIAVNLAELPLMAEAEGSHSTDYLAAWAPAGTQLAGEPSPTPGLVLDWTGIGDANWTNYTFASYSAGSGPTYYFGGGANWAYFYGTVTFDANCVVKFDGGNSLALYGNVQCNGTQDNPSVLTSSADCQYGAYIYGPGQGYYPGTNDVGTALCFDNGSQACPTLSGLVIRYATTAIEWGTPCLAGDTITVENCAFYKCTIGLAAMGKYIVITNSAVNAVPFPLTLDCYSSVSGSFSQGQGPLSATTAFQVAEVQQSGNNVTFSATDAPPTVVNWYNGPSTLLGTGSTLSLNWTQPGAYDIYASKYNPFGTNWNQAYYLAVANSVNYNSLMTFAGQTNGQTYDMWATLPLQAVNPPGSIQGNYQWNTNSILYKKGSFTAISQLNYWNLTNNNGCNCPGQTPMTALTRRHVISAGHSFVGNGGGWQPLSMPTNGAPIWFCDAGNNITQMTAVAGYGRDDSGGDYSVFILNQDLPSSITPMAVDNTQAEWWTIYLQTEQHGYVAAYTPGFPVESAQWLPPFNNFLWGVPGDSGSPTMLLAYGQLVLVGASLSEGTTTTGEALNNIQADMNLLISDWNSTNTPQLNAANYQMQGWSDAQ